MKLLKLLLCSIFLLSLSSCSSFNDWIFGNKFYYKNGYEAIQLAKQDITSLKNIHPVKISVPRIEGALKLILVKDKLKTYPLFTEKKINKFAVGISEALREASTSQDVIFTMEGWYTAKYVSKNKVSSGRVFYNKSGLNIIFGSILRKGNKTETDPLLMAGLNPDLKANPYVPGSRTQSIRNPYVLSAPPNQGVFRPRQAKGRVDWLVFTPKALKPRSNISERDRKIAYRSNIQVQDLRRELKQLKSELRNIKNYRYQNIPVAPYGYQAPATIPYGYGYPVQNNQYRYPNTNQNNSINNNLELKALKSMRQKGVISEKEFRARLEQLGY